MSTTRNQQVKNFLKKLKYNFLLKTTKSEMILLVVVIALIVFKYSDKTSTSKLPVGDYGPSPYETHINSQARE